MLPPTKSEEENVTFIFILPFFGSPCAYSYTRALIVHDNCRHFITHMRPQSVNEQKYCHELPYHDGSQTFLKSVIFLPKKASKLCYQTWPDIRPIFMSLSSIKILPPFYCCGVVEYSAIFTFFIGSKHPWAFGVNTAAHSVPWECIVLITHVQRAGRIIFDGNESKFYQT